MIAQTQTLREMLLNTVSDSEKAVAALTLEIEQKQATLRVEQERLAHARGLLALMGEQGQAEAKQSDDQPAPFYSENPNAVMTSEEGFGPNRISKKSRMVAETTKFLDRGTAHRREILAHLVSVGLMGTEKDPLAALAAFLSEHRHLFESDGRGRFRMRSTGPAEPPPAPSGAGSAEGRNPGSNPGLPFNHQQH